MENVEQFWENQLGKYIELGCAVNQQLAALVAVRCRSSLEVYTW